MVHGGNTHEDSAQVRGPLLMQHCLVITIQHMFAQGMPLTFQAVFSALNMFHENPRWYHYAVYARPFVNSTMQEYT